MPVNAASVAESAQSVLQSGSRLLLMIAMALFLAYVLFLLCTVAASSAITTWHALRIAARARRQAGTSRLPSGAGYRGGPVHAGKHAMSA